MIIALVIIIISLVLSFITSNKILAPTTVTSAVWLFIILAYWLYPHGYYPMGVKFYTGISLWILFFTLFSLTRQSIAVRKRYTEAPTQLIRDIYFIITLISFPLSVWGIYSILQQYGITTNILASLRKIAIGSLKGLDEGMSNNYFATFWLVTYAIELLHYNRKNLVRIIILVLINLVWAFLVMAKLNFLNLLFATLSILFFKNIIKPKVIYFSFGLIFVFFSFIQIARTVDAKDKSDLKYDFFSLYVLSGVPAFEQTKAQSSYNFGESTFRFFYKVGEKAKLTNEEAEDALQKFINVGVKKESYTNIYTTLYPFYKDFGYLGIALFASLIGLFYGYLYKGLLNKNNPFVIIYSILLTSLFIQFMSESTVTAFSFVVQIIVFSHIPYIASGYIHKKQLDKNITE